MAEMTPRGKICVVRPLLEAEPAALRRLLRENGIVWAEDASNGCDDFLRVRIRKFLPELEKKTGISIRRLAETARALPAVIDGSCHWNCFPFKNQTVDVVRML